ncbi:SRPBCC family protein [Kitasatospora sp. NPDC088134]|uniref:SRPBCC family protein n=1 Tax=Kitasatospora sp. NPDC088134 TaxID=3364071 RepID=UPI0037F18FA3
MPSTELSQTYEIGATPETVLSHLAEPENYLGLSPLLVEVRDIRRAADVTHYTAVERFRFLGLLDHDNAIRVTLRTDRTRLPDGATVGGDVTSPGGVRMRYSFALAPHTAGTTRVTDTLHLQAPFGLLRFAARQAAAVQTARARILAERLGPA